jgi:hypothetical protein
VGEVAVKTVVSAGQARQNKENLPSVVDEKNFRGKAAFFRNKTRIAASTLVLSAGRARPFQSVKPV